MVRTGRNPHSSRKKTFRCGSASMHCCAAAASSHATSSVPSSCIARGVTDARMPGRCSAIHARARCRTSAASACCFKPFDCRTPGRIWLRRSMRKEEDSYPTWGRMGWLWRDAHCACSSSISTAKSAEVNGSFSIWSTRRVRRNGLWMCCVHRARSRMQRGVEVRLFTCSRCLRCGTDRNPYGLFCVRSSPPAVSHESIMRLRRSVT